MSDASTIAALEAKLLALETAELQLATGTQVVEATYDGHTVKYTPGNVQQLRDMIARTRIEIRRAKYGRGAGIAGVTL